MANIIVGHVNSCSNGAELPRHIRRGHAEGGTGEVGARVGKDGCTWGQVGQTMGQDGAKMRRSCGYDGPRCHSDKQKPSGEAKMEVSDRLS